MMKKSYTASFKAQVVLELLKETKPLNQLASDYQIAPTVLREWRQAAKVGFGTWLGLAIAAALKLALAFAMSHF